MNVALLKKTLVLSACVSALALAGCGGGSGGGPRPQPAPIAPPSPPPPPPPASPPPPSPPSGTNFNDEEYQRSNGANSHGAIAAHQAGGTGKNIKIGIIDSGINPNLSEFAGRIDPASADVAANRGVTDTEGHGTAVSAVAAAARNGSGMLGVAFESTILSFNSSNPNNCDLDDGCSHYGSDIAEGIDLARMNGARVINISLGGNGAGSAVMNAIQRATATGIIVVVSAGNEAKLNPSQFALDIARAGNGLVIIAGAIDSAGQMASFSNQAGSAATTYLAALGVRVRTIDHSGAAYLYSGTSFSAPVISGAVALLASAFPNLTSAQIIDILFKSADNAGDTGRDTAFGNGILNITRAFQPMGQTSMAGSEAPVSLDDNGEGSPTMGDAAGPTSVMKDTIILDGYARAYKMDLGRTISRPVQDQPLASALSSKVRSAAAGNGKVAVTLTVRQNEKGQAHVGLAQLGLIYEGVRQAKALAGHAVTHLSPKTAIAFGFSESGRTLQQRLSGHEQNAFLVARDPLSRTGFQADSGTSLGIRHDVGPFALTVTSERGSVWNPRYKATLNEPHYSISTIAADRKVGPAKLSIGASRLDEESTVLGGRFSSAFGSRGATSWFVDGTASFDLGRGWSAAASYRHGTTNLPGTGALIENGRLFTNAFAFDLAKRNLLFGGDYFSLRLMQPLRVSSGGLNLNVPVSYDYRTRAVGFDQRFLNLSPSGREIDVEAAYGMSLMGGHLSLNGFIRTDPGHIEAMNNDIGGAVRYTLGF